jgi:phage terminase large subunit-like protein
VSVLATALGRPLMPWQDAAVDVALEIDPATGLNAYTDVLVKVPRQAGKTLLTGAVGEYRCLSRRDARVWITAQTGRDAGDWMRDEHLPLLEGTDALAGKWTRRLSAGAESVRWPSLGSMFRVFPPLRDALHGKQSDLVFVDEAWAFTADAGDQLMVAIGPTQATRPGAQVWVLSAEGDDASTFLHAWTERAQLAVAADTGRGLCVISYGVPDGLDAADPEIVARYHPAVGHTIDAGFLAAELDRIGAPAFARAYGNRRTGARAAVIDPDAWRILARPIAPPAGRRVALGFDVDPDSAAASLAAAWRDPDDGKLRVQLRQHAAGVAWLPDAVAEHWRRWSPSRIAYDPAGPAGATADRLARAGRQLMPLSGRDYAAACSSLLDAFRDRALAHDGAHPVALAVAAADRRAVGDAWVWDRRAAVALSPLIALTMAAWAVDHAPAPSAAPDVRAL